MVTHHQHHYRPLSVVQSCATLQRCVCSVCIEAVGQDEARTAEN